MIWMECTPTGANVHQSLQLAIGIDGLQQGCGGNHILLDCADPVWIGIVHMRDCSKMDDLYNLLAIQ